MLVLAAGSAPAWAEGNSPGSWTMKAPVAPGVRAAAAVVYHGQPYALGGGVAGHAVGGYEEYDPAPDRGRARAPMPVGRDHRGVAVFNGKLYSFGGLVIVVDGGKWPPGKADLHRETRATMSSAEAGSRSLPCSGRVALAPAWPAGTCISWAARRGGALTTGC
jgi:hypothetical protein